MKKKAISLLLALVMVLAMVPVFTVPALAATYSGTIRAGLSWTLDTETGVFNISGVGDIPQYNSDSQTLGRSPWFFYRDSIQQVIISEGVTSIGHNTFNNCINLTYVSIPNTVTTIGAAFGNCTSLESIIIPDSVISLYGTFRGCTSLSSVDLSNSLEQIGSQSTFQDCSNLTQIVLPDSLREIGDYSFQDCISLENIIIPDAVESIGGRAFSGCTNLKSVQIGSLNDIHTNVEIDISHYAFSGCTSLTDLILGSSVKSINGRYAFSGSSNLKSVYLTKSTTFLAFYTFLGCSNLTDVYYTGTEQDKQNIYVASSGNSSFVDATWHYSYVSAGNEGDGNSKTDEPGNPSVVSLYPSNGVIAFGTASSTNQKVGFDAFAITFDRKVAKSSPNDYTAALDYSAGTIGIYRDSDDALIWESSPTMYSPDFDFSLVLDSAQTTLSIRPTNSHALLDFNEKYYVVIDEGFIKFENGATNPAIAKGEWAFTTITKQSANENTIDNTITKHTIAFNVFESIAWTKYVNMDVNWGWDLFNQSANTYDNDLAIIGLALSRATEDSETKAEDMLRTLGFEFITSYNYDKSPFAVGVTAFTIATKEVVFDGQPHNIFIIVNRGSSDTGDWITNATSIGGGFSGAALIAKSIVLDYMEAASGKYLSQLKNENNIFFITGHSLGGAVANLLSNDFYDYAPPSQTFVYTYATPRTLPTQTPANNVYNIINKEDIVPMVPPNLFGRFGNNISFKWKDEPSISIIYDMLTNGIKLQDVKTINPKYAHSPTLYMAYLLSEADKSIVSYNIRVARIFCPVDVFVYNDSGELVGSVVNNIAESSEVFIYADGDEKYIYMPFDGEYSFKLIGTADGTMDYSVVDIDSETGSETAVKLFDDVPLYDGKLMASFSGREVDVPNTRLFTIDSDNKINGEIQADGTEASTTTYVPLTSISLNSTSINLTQGQSKELEVKLNPIFTTDDTTIIWTSSNENIATVNGGVVTAIGNGSAIITAQIGWLTVNVTVTVTSASTGSLGAVPGSNVIAINNAENGTITASNTNATKGEKITLTVTPNFDYELVTLSITDKNGNAVAYTKNSDGTFTFTMSDTNVTIDATFMETNWSNPFTDVQEADWFFDAVKSAYENDIMNGITATEFAPTENLTRAMFVQILYNLEGQPSAGISNFTDVANSAWYADAISWAADNTIVSGVGDNLFAPNDEITREQMAVMLYNYCVFKGIEVPNTRTVGAFADADKISTWATETVNAMYAAKILNGKGGNMFDPQGTATRAEVAQMFMNFIEVIK